MVGQKALMAGPKGQHLGTLQKTANAVGILLLVHHFTLSLHAPVMRQAKERTL